MSLRPGTRFHTTLAAWAAGLGTGGVAWLALLCLTMFLVLLPFSSYVAALSFIQLEWGLNNTQAGAVFSALLAGYAISALLVIPLTDRWAARPIFLASAALSVVAHALFPLLANDIVSGTVLRMVAGAGLVGVYMPGLRMISERFPVKGRGAAMGFFVTIFYAANSASLAGTGALMSLLDWEEAYLTMALISAFSIPLAYFLFRSHGRTRIADGSGRLDIGVLKNRASRVFILGYSLHAVELYAVRVWLPAFLMAALVARGADPADAAVTAATVGGIALAAGAAGPVMGGLLSDRWGRPISAAAIFGLSGACSWAIGWLGGFPWAVVVGLAVVYGWAVAADSAIYSTAITEVVGPTQVGSTMALQAFLGFFGGVVGPIMVGGVLDVAPESIKWGVGFSLVGLFAVAAIAALVRLHLSPDSASSATG